ncbi:UNVERIFIED_CONTAM: Retrovirus-related Pol polyprotein from transposon [Sesamum angustifolium]|uniref:Retrovirus-related Pol polyprotein from transposon n=1 Tax=Sesamum angustifolium TaxID=2727405 RepID=A0AAW2JI15_9LAMI
MFIDEKGIRQASENEIRSRLDQVIEVQEGLPTSVINVEHSLLTVQQLQSVVEQLQQYNRNKFIFGESLTTSLEKGSTSRVVVHNSCRLEGSNISRQEHHSQQNTETYSALNKMEFPYFDGENSSGWVRRCTRCKYRQVYMFLSDKDAREYDRVEQDESSVEREDTKKVTVSLHAIKGDVTCKTLRVNGLVGDKEVLILINCGNTHYFVYEKVSSTLGCKLEETTPMIVRVADGSKIVSRLIYPCSVRRCIPMKQHPYRYSYGQKTEIERIVKEMLDNGIIKPSQSSFVSPLLLVMKKDGAWRLCVDYRYLNKLTIKHNFPIPIIDEVLNDLHGAKYFCKIDLRSGYFQIRMRKEGIPKASFITHSCHYKFLVMPFGLCDTPSTFQALTNSVFEPYPTKFVLVFFDDILIYSKDWELHLVHLKKIIFDTSYLERVFPLILKRLNVWSTAPLQPLSRPLRGFLGLTRYYGKFIRGYGTISKPLTSLLKKDALRWNSEANTTWNQLNEMNG